MQHRQMLAQLSQRVPAQQSAICMQPYTLHPCQTSSIVEAIREVLITFWVRQQTKVVRTADPGGG